MTTSTRPRRKLVHFVSLDTQEPLCGGGGTEDSGAAVNGVSVCAACARRMADAIDGGAALAARPRRSPRGGRAAAPNVVRRR